MLSFTRQKRAAPAWTVANQGVIASVGLYCLMRGSWEIRGWLPSREALGDAISTHTINNANTLTSWAHTINEAASTKQNLTLREKHNNFKHLLVISCSAVLTDGFLCQSKQVILPDLLCSCKIWFEEEQLPETPPPPPTNPVTHTELCTWLQLILHKCWQVGLSLNLSFVSLGRQRSFPTAAVRATDARSLYFVLPFKRETALLSGRC